jgi:ribonuclease P protein component
LLPREHRLRSSREIREVISRGKRASNSVATLHYRPAPKNRFAIVVSKAVGNAVHRNLVKRRMRSILAKQINANPAIEGVFRMRPNTSDVSYTDLSSQIEQLMGRAR